MDILTALLFLGFIANSKLMTAVKATWNRNKTLQNNEVTK